MTPETQNDDLQKLMKEQVRLTKWLTRIVFYQAVVVIPFGALALWMFLFPLLSQSHYY